MITDPYFRSSNKAKVNAALMKASGTQGELATALLKAEAAGTGQYFVNLHYHV